MPGLPRAWAGSRIAVDGSPAPEPTPASPASGRHDIGPGSGWGDRLAGPSAAPSLRPISLGTGVLPATRAPDGSPGAEERLDRLVSPGRWA